MPVWKTNASRLRAAALIPILSAGQGWAQETAAEGDGTLLAPVVVEPLYDWDENHGAADRAGSVYVGREEFERRQPQSIKEVFSGESGVSVGGAHALARKIFVNGIEETQLNVTVDGGRQNRKVFHHAATNYFDPSVLKAVRVDPGVAPADAGPGALGGSIVFETVDAADVLAPGDNFGGTATTSYNTNGDVFAGGLTLVGRGQGFEGLAAFRLGDGDDYEDGDGLTVFGTETDFQTYLLKGAYQSDTGHRVELSGERIDDEADRPFRANFGALNPPRPGEPVVRDYDFLKESFAFNYETTTPHGLYDPKVVVAYNSTRLKVPDPFGSVGEASGWNATIQNRFNFGDDSVTVGVDFYDEEAFYEDPTFPKVKEDATNIGGFVQARFSPLPGLRLSAGARVDHQWFEGTDGSEFENTGLSANVAVAYDVTSFATLRAGYSNVFGGISLDEPFLFNPAWNYAGIDTVRAENVTAGVELHHMGFTASAGYFLSDFDNARDAGFSTGPYTPFDFKSEGYTLAAGYSWGDGFIRASFTDAKVTTAGAPSDSFTLQYFGTPTGEIIAIEAGHSFTDYGVSLGASLDAALSNDSLTSQGLLELPGYAAANFFVEYQPPAAEFLAVRLTAINLFDETYSDRASYGQEFGSVTPLREPGQSFLFSARVTF